MIAAVISIAVAVFCMGIYIGKITYTEGREETNADSRTNTIPIESGEQIEADLNGDGQGELISVRDIRNDDEAYTQISANVNGKTVTKKYEGYYATNIDVGDLTGDGKADVLLKKYNTGSTYAAVELAILHLEGKEWVEYPDIFIPNPQIDLEQPDRFQYAEHWWDLELYIDATLFERDQKTMVRFIALTEVNTEKVKVIEASYREEGWYIENISIIDHYYSENKWEELT